MEKSFINIGEAAELLLAAGYKVQLDSELADNGCARTALCVDDHVAVAWGYRDGTTWKFKASTIQDFIDDPRNQPEENLACPEKS